MKRISACFLLFFLVMGFLPGYSEIDREANKKIIFDYITGELNLTPAVACGILSNIRAESNFNPEAIGDSGEAYGICQWNSRRNSLIKFCEENGYGDWTNIYGQLAYLGYELENNKKNVGDYLKEIPNTASGAYDAAYYFCYYYEIPSNRATKSKQRGTNAVNTYWRDYYGGTVDTYTITYDANGGSNPPRAQSKTEGIPTLITLSSPTLVGHSFVGWALTPDAITPDYKPQDEFFINQDTTLYAVWERAIEAETPPDASVTLGDHRYELYTGAFTWIYANSFSEIKGGYLASIETQAEYDAVKSLIAQAGGDCWLGGKYEYGNWQWSTKEAFKDDFAASKWAQDEPFALHGPNERGSLAQKTDGTWADLSPSSVVSGGFIVEYGEKTKEDFPMYKITVSTSLNLREGPGTSYTSLNYLYNGEIITICETYPGSSYNWGWGYTTNGKTGWCAMRIPNYMVSIGGIDEETGLIYSIYEDGCAILGYEGAAKELVLPASVQDLPVVAVLESAFSAASSPDTVKLPASVRMISEGSMKTGGKYIVTLGSDAHLAAAGSGHLYECIYPKNTLCPPAALTEIGADAFEDASGFECIDLSCTSVRLISSGAFIGADALQFVVLPENEITVEFAAFDLTKDILFIVKKGSSAEEWALSNEASHMSVP